MNPLTPDARNAIVESIAHWRDIKHSIMASDNKAAILLRLYIAGELGSEKCELCHYAKAISEKNGNEFSPCIYCPLYVADQRCTQLGSPYMKVIDAIFPCDNAAIMPAVDAMLAALESLLPKEEL